MQAVTHPRVAVVCRVAMEKYRHPIVVDRTGHFILDSTNGQTCVRVTPPVTRANPFRKKVFTLEEFVDGNLKETVTLVSKRGRFYVQTRANAM